MKRPFCRRDIVGYANRVVPRRQGRRHAANSTTTRCWWGLIAPRYGISNARNANIRRYAV